MSIWIACKKSKSKIKNEKTYLNRPFRIPKASNGFFGNRLVLFDEPLSEDIGVEISDHEPMRAELRQPRNMSSVFHPSMI